MLRRLVLLALLVAGAIASTADAGLVVSIGNLDLLPGQTGQVQVLIRSDADDTLDVFNLEFLITTGGTSRLEFVTLSPPNATDPHLGMNAYLLHNDSAAEAVPPAGIIDTTTANNDTYIGGDGTVSGSGVSVPSTFALLTILEVTADTSAPPVVGDVFTIQLVVGPNTVFYTPDWEEISYTSTSGTVRVVPEPGIATAVLSGVMTLPFAFGGRLRRRRG